MEYLRPFFLTIIPLIYVFYLTGSHGVKIFVAIIDSRDFIFLVGRGGKSIYVLYLVKSTDEKVKLKHTLVKVCFNV